MDSFSIRIDMKKSCPECGYPLQGSERICPECGYPLHADERNPPEWGFHVQSEGVKSEASAPQEKMSQPIYQEMPQLPPNVNNPTVVVATEKIDRANYIYECGVITWNVFRYKFASPYGRASRREYWSFWIIGMFLGLFGGIFFLIMLIPWICVSIRRMHDINRCGWWCLVPIASFFMLLKKSDEGENRYGMPNPAINMI